MKVLVVEDSKMINNTIAKKLKGLNFEVFQAFTLSEAEELLDKHKFDLIILDLHLPDGDGIDIISYIHSLHETKVVVLTSSVDLQVREELFRYGILDYIVKDKNLLYSIEEIIRVIRRIEENKNEKILVIDDSKVVCRQIKKILEPRNYKVDIALSGKEGFEKLRNNKYSLIILDLSLPDQDGMEILEALRKDPKFNMTPIIVLSGMVTPSIIRDVLKSGANDFLQKPFVFEEFILKVDIWIDYFKKERKLEEMTKELEFINQNLKKLVEEEIQKNREKDKLMFLQARHAQMGEAMSIIAHQWKQPLNAISLIAASLGLKAQFNKLSKDEMLELVSKISQYTKNLGEIVDEFRDFFRPKKEKTKTTLKEIFEKAKDLVEPIMKDKNIELDVIIKGVKEIEVYENELIQVVVNILKNAIDVLDEKNIENPLIKIEIDTNKISIEDNGGGIPDDIKDKIFEPYFSTKSLNGTGIGLYMSKIIVEDHCKGELKVENTSNGAKFTIYCP